MSFGGNDAPGQVDDRGMVRGNAAGVAAYDAGLDGDQMMGEDDVTASGSVMFPVDRSVLLSGIIAKRGTFQAETDRREG